MEHPKKFNKILNTGDVLVTAFGAMIGWGWVVSTGNWVSSAGVLGTILGFLIGGLAIFFVGLTYAELTTAMPKCGGEHIFSYEAFGAIGSFICTWAIILSYIGVVCFEACSLPTVIQYIYPGFLQGYLYTIAGFDVYATWLIVAIIFAVIITYINIRGIKAAAVFQTILTIVIGVVGISLVVASLFNGDVSNLEGQVFVSGGVGECIQNILSVAVVAPFFLMGFDVIPQTAEEINVPLKKLGRLLILSIIMAVAFYALIVFAVGYSLSAKEISNSEFSASLVTADAMSKAFGSVLMAKVLIIGGICGIITSWNSFLIGGSRTIFSMAEDNMIPKTFTKLHAKYKTPINALMLVGGLSVVAPFFGRATLVWIANVASFSCCVAYCMVSISFLVLRWKRPDLARPYRIKKHRIVGILATCLSGFLATLYIIPGTSSSLSLQEWIICGVWLFLGAIFAITCKIKYKEKFCLRADEYGEKM